MAEPDKLEISEMEGESIEEIDAGGDAKKGTEGTDVDAQVMAPAALAGQLMQNPQVLAALQGRLEGMIGTRSGYIENLPKVVKRRLKGLKKLQFEMIKIEAEFYKEVHELECKYAAKYAPIFDKRQEIVTGGIEPTDSDCDWPSDEENEEEKKLIDDLQKKAKVEEVDETKEAAKENGQTEKKEKEEEKEEENVEGVPEFWLTIFKNVDLLADMVQEHDEPILKHLQDIKVHFQESNPMGFTLEFIFKENEFFTNQVLTKQYIMRSDPDVEDPFGFEGPEIIKCIGCKIDWSKGKNVTVKVVKKTQKHKGRGTKRTVTKTVQNDSFFNFFTPPEAPEEGEEADDETENLLAADFEIGHYIRERIVPRAVLYFTGDALEDDDFEEEEEGEEEDDEDYDEDEDPDFNPEQGGGGQQAGDCKQQ